MSNSTVTEFDSPSTPMEKIDQNLSNLFGTKPMEMTVIDSAGAVISESNDALDTDADHVRSNMYALLQQGNDALQYALELAKQSDSPRAFEVVGTLMKNLSDMNMQLLDAHDKKQKIKKPAKDEPGPQKVVNNSIVFQGSTADLNRMLNDMRKEQ